VMKNAWTKIEANLAAHAPDVHEALRAPAEPRAVAAAETKLSLKFPKLLRESLAIHDGMNAEALFELWRLLSADEIGEQWRGLVHLLDAGDFADCRTEHDKKVGDGWFRRGWIPFAADGYGNLLCVDMQPGPRGKPGQVVCFWHDDAARKVEGADLLAWFRRVARELPKEDRERPAKPVIVGKHAFRNAKAAQICAVRGQTDLAMAALRGFREQGDATAAAALSVLHAFRGEWDAVVDLSSFVLANSTFLGLLGYELDEFTRLTVADITDPDQVGFGILHTRSNRSEIPVAEIPFKKQHFLKAAFFCNLPGAQ